MTQGPLGGWERENLWAIDGELYAAVGMLTFGARAVRDMRFVATDHAAVLALLAGGMERLVKLTVGLLGLTSTGRWPTRRTHDVARLDQECREQLGASEMAPYFRQLLTDLSTDSVAEKLVEVVSDYASTGRYHQLDLLESRPRTGRAPALLWRGLDDVAFECLDAADRQIRHGEANPSRRPQLNAVIQDAVLRWWTVYATAWKHGLAGPVARRWSSRVGPVDLSV